MKPRIQRVIAGAPNRPLRIGDIEIPCFVLEDGTRVLTQRGIYSALTGTGASSGAQIVRFIGRNWIKPFLPEDLASVLKSPILFPWKTKKMLGTPAEILPGLCSSITDARLAGATTSRQEHIFQRARIIEKASAAVGIIALVDEATGYQYFRDRDALHKFLDLYLMKEQARCSKRFPDEFYIQIFRLRGWKWKGMKINRPQVVGLYTNQIVWSRLAPGILDELNKLNPPTPNGTRVHRHHQFLTNDIGHPALEQHLQRVIGIMQASLTWRHFQDLLATACPKRHENKVLPFEQ